MKIDISNEKCYQVNKEISFKIKKKKLFFLNILKKGNLLNYLNKKTTPISLMNIIPIVFREK